MVAAAPAPASTTRQITKAYKIHAPVSEAAIAAVTAAARRAGSGGQTGHRAAAAV